MIQHVSVKVVWTIYWMRELEKCTRVESEDQIKVQAPRRDFPLRGKRDMKGQEVDRVECKLGESGKENKVGD